MKNSIDSLFSTKAGKVWKFFSEVCKIPRPSKHEERIGKYLESIALTNNWQIKRDNLGNLAFSIPGKGRLSNSPILILQSHTDMVCEKNRDVIHDFMKDPIIPYSDGEWIRSDGTTLGSDNGVGVALMLALAESNIKDCLPLELLFTIDEETGLTGAMGMDKNLVKGQRLLNLDSEDDGVLTIGCSGGMDMEIQFRKSSIKSKSVAPGSMWEIHISGLRGGHSGVSIHENRLNAILLAAEYLDHLRKQNNEMEILHFEGGNKKNAIPREAKFTVAGCSKSQLNTVSKLMKARVHEIENGAEFTIEKKQGAITRCAPRGVIDFLLKIPNGVIAMDPHYPNLVQTSSSVGVVCDHERFLSILVHGRSSSKTELSDLEKMVKEKSKFYNGEFDSGSQYPGWRPNPKSKILEDAIKVFKSGFGHEPEVTAMHAGLETGILGEILNIDELLSIGPTIKDAHAPTERVNIKTVENTFSFLTLFVSAPSST